jgi:predicted esterase
LSDLESSLEISVATTVHGRVLVAGADAGAAIGTLVSFHGYAQSAGEALAEALAIPGLAAWRVVAIQALHRFYTRGDREIVASWMTRQDRENAIADNIAYVDAALDEVFARQAAPRAPIVYVGFSQGVAMAYRAALRGRHHAAGIVALAGDIPPDVDPPPDGREWPPVLIGVGDRETWYSPEKVSRDRTLLGSRGVRHEIKTFAGGHEWTDDFRERVRDFTTRITRDTKE